MYSCFVVNISRKSLLVDTCITHTDYKYTRVKVSLPPLFAPFAFSISQPKNKKKNRTKKRIGRISTSSPLFSSTSHFNCARTKND